MGRHRRPLTGGARYTVVRVTTAVGVAGALAIAIQQTHEVPVSRARPESPHSVRSAAPPLAVPDRRGPGRGEVGGAPVPVGPHHRAAAPSAAAGVRSAVPAPADIPVLPETGPSATVVPLLPTLPDGTPGARAASPSSGVAPESTAGDTVTGAPAAPETERPATDPSSGTEQGTDGPPPSLTPSPSPSPVRTIADLLHDLVAPGADGTETGAPQQSGSSASASAG
ncbi:hypothetical protein I3F58_18200 [Streptomyces sp. MUM 203J]|uniref:hypothetical protein n=1 Tax=Streptomyces sp. MUM 203J TaxID=2791990 RepID=UPI001F04CC15|nr:hypothetical protein [Streptomyces sp. MUM 203J]MCH0541456.1 hypothetical protein [Streptomyces sp. MUM 203J]